jgi:hypothetical protein
LSSSRSCSLRDQSLLELGQLEIDLELGFQHPIEPHCGNPTLGGST